MGVPISESRELDTRQKIQLGQDDRTTSGKVQLDQDDRTTGWKSNWVRRIGELAESSVVSGGSDN